MVGHRLLPRQRREVLPPLEQTTMLMKPLLSSEKTTLRKRVNFLDPILHHRTTAHLGPHPCSLR